MEEGPQSGGSFCETSLNHPEAHLTAAELEKLPSTELALKCKLHRKTDVRQQTRRQA